MPLLFEKVDNLGFFTAEGDVNFNEGMQVLLSGLDQFDAESGNPAILFNLQKSTENRSSDELRDIATIIARNLPNARLAILVSSDFYYGISRMFATYADLNELDTMIFRDKNEAMAWCLEG